MNLIDFIKLEWGNQQLMVGMQEGGEMAWLRLIYTNFYDAYYKCLFKFIIVGPLLI